jgi:hypothetical protein
MQLGRLLVLSKRFDEAERELLEADRVISANTNPPAVRHIPYLRALTELYTQWDQSDPGKGHNTKAAAQQKLLDAARAKLPLPSAK